MVADEPMCWNAWPSPHGRGGLALAERSGGDGRDDDVLGAGPVLHSLDGIEVDLGGARAVGLEAVLGDAGMRGDLTEWLQTCAGGDFQVGRNAHAFLFGRF